MENALRNQEIQTEFKLRKLGKDNHLQRWGNNIKLELKGMCFHWSECRLWLVLVAQQPICINCHRKKS